MLTFLESDCHENAPSPFHDPGRCSYYERSPGETFAVQGLAGQNTVMVIAVTKIISVPCSKVEGV